MIIKKRSGTKFIAKLPDDEDFVGMTIFKDQVIVCSTKSIYKLINDKLVRQKIELKK